MSGKPKEKPYYYAVKGETQGPFNVSQMQELFDTGVIATDTNVWSKGMAEWMPLSQSPLHNRLVVKPKDIPVDRKDISDTVSLPAPPPKPKPPSGRRKSERRPSLVNSELLNVSPPRAERSKVVSISQMRRASRKLSRRNPSQCFIEEFELGALIWVEDAVEVWKLCQVISQNSNTLEVEFIEERKKGTVDINFQETHRHNPHVVPDMTSLHYLHEASILYNLGVRAAEHKPYTYMGSVLIAVNPLQDVPMPDMSLYNDTAARQSMPPHPYAIAATCIQQLNSCSGLNQSVVISGESGAGKTETAKIILNYLVKRSTNTSEEGLESLSEVDKTLDNRLIQSSHVLESFGNAVTSKNSNSSRFGKFMKIYFSPARKQGGVGRLLGAAIETYLLEKSRVASQYSTERNYHVFYQLVSACVASTTEGNNPSWLTLIPDDVKATLCAGVSYFSILRVHDAESYPDDLSKFIRLSDSLQTLDIETHMVSEFWTILCGILLLGNVTFAEADSQEGPVAVVEEPEVCAAAAYFLGVDEDGLYRQITERTMVTRGELFTIHLTKYDAECARDAICKFIYEGLFSLLVRAINGGMATEEIVTDAPYSRLRFIGVLDVFGFESFENNDFEQLLINFANESLQDTFNVQVFQAEMRLFEEENIHCSVTSHPDNKACVEMIAGKPNGIFAHLDNICKLPKPSDEKFCEELHASLAKHRHFPQTHPKDKKNNFWVKHYAGNVKYTVWNGERNDASKGLGETNQWVMKNNDSNPEGILPLLRSSSYQCVQMLYPESGDTRKLTKGESFANYKWGGDFSGKAENQAPNPPKSSRMTIASSFVQSMAGLNNILLSTQCSFIRCIKPNAVMKAGLYDKNFVVGQIRCLGLVQACEILRIGLPHRIAYADLKASVSYILEEAIEIFKGESEEVFIASLFYGFEVPPEAYRLGRTRAFFRTGQLAALEGMLSDGAELRREEIIARLYEALEIRKEARLLAESCKHRVLAAEQSVLHLKKSYEILEQASCEPVGDSTSLASAHMISANYEYSVYQRLIEDIKGLFYAIKRNTPSGDTEAKSKIEEDALNIATIDGQPEINSELLRLASSCCHALDVAEKTFDIVSQRMAAMHAADKLAKENSELHTVVAELWDHLNHLEELIVSARTKSRDAEDGALRCQLEYTANRAQICESVLTSIDMVTTEMNKLTAHAHAIVTGDYDGHRKTQLVADEIVNICIKEVKEAEKVFEQCKELLKAKEEAEKVFQENEDRRAMEEQALCGPDVSATYDTREESEADVHPSGSGGSKQVMPTSGGSSFKNRGKYAALSAIRKKMASSARSSVTAVETPVKIEEPIVEEPERVVGALPEGWAEYIDESRGLPYYYNLHSQATQWERPTECALPIEKDDDSHAPGSDDHSCAAPSEDGMSMHSEEEDIHMLDDVYILPKPEGMPRGNSMRMSSRITPDEFERVGMTTKTGILMKRSKYLRLWKKRFVVVEDSKLMYYKKSQDYNAGVRSSDKTMTLTPESMTSFTTVKNVFSIKQRDPLSTGVGDVTGSRIRRSISRKKASKSEQWFLMAQDDYEMHEWVTAISAHIHVVHMLSANYQKTRDDYLSLGTAGVDFWHVSLGRSGGQKLPIGIRTIPEFTGPRTGEGLYPGEVFEVVYRFNVYDSDETDEATEKTVINSFLKLADDRGWVFERHPKTNVPLVANAEGDYQKADFKCTYKSEFSSPLDVMFGPCRYGRKTGTTVAPSEDVAISAVFALKEPDLIGHSSGIAFGGTAESIEFYKLADGRGWVPRANPQGVDFFQKSITRENPLLARRAGR